MSAEQTIINNIRESVRKQREELISKRSLTEKNIDLFREDLKRLSPGSLERISHINLEDLDAKKLFPSLYEETFDKARYLAEREAYIQMTIPIVQLRDELIKKAQMAISS